MQIDTDLEIVTCGDIAVCYFSSNEGGHVEMQLIPTNLLKSQVSPRISLRKQPEIRSLPESWGDFSAQSADSLLHFKCTGDAYGSGFSGGTTMRNSHSLDCLRFRERSVHEDDSGVQIRSEFTSGHGLVFVHEVTWERGCPVLKVVTHCSNAGSQRISLEALSSFSLGGLTPFDSSDACGRLRLHRFRSWWSAEGRPISESIESLHLERSWTGHSQISERFGQVGSMPVRGYFPYAAIEDTKAHVTWAAQICHPGSWQMELYRRGDKLHLSGGLADREFGHWMRHLDPGDSMSTPEALLTVVEGAPEAANRRLLDWQRVHWESRSDGEEEMAIAFNDWCTHWGYPSHQKLLSIANKLKGTPVKYFVIDDGWSARTGAGQANGDWEVDTNKFPDGLKATCDAIRENGLIPGIWFEFETCTEGTKAYEKVERLLSRDGMPLVAGTRRFWDFRDPWVHDYLSERMIGLIKECGFGYLKVDYNETVGLGCDSLDGSLGEGLRQHLAGVQRFWKRMRDDLPELVVENCASGGHRLEPTMLALSDISSISDAHETVEIPLIASHLHQLLLARQMQIWAVLRKDDDLCRLQFSMAATFLGRMVLSGDIHQLSEKQWAVVDAGMRFYQSSSRIIRDGVPTRYGPEQKSFRHPEGWQAVVFDAGDTVLAVVHTYSGPLPASIVVPLPRGAWHTDDSFGLADTACSEITCDHLQLSAPLAHWGGAIRLSRDACSAS